QLLLEAAKYFRIAGEVGTNQLDGDEAVELCVAGFVNSTHAALAKQGDDFVTFGEHGADELFTLRSGWAGGGGNRDRPSGGAARNFIAHGSSVRRRPAERSSAEGLVSK